VERQFCAATAGPLYPCPLPPARALRFAAGATAVAVSPFQAIAALHPANQAKNNSLDFVAVDWSRVRLTAGGSVVDRRRSSLASLSDLTSSGCSSITEDYVNATWVAGYSGPRDFVLSHHPGPASLSQFWRMVHQTRAAVIVCLSIVPQPFWPVDTAAPLRFDLHDDPFGGGGNDLDVWLESEGFTGGYRSSRVNLAVTGGGGDGCGDAAANEVRSVQLIFCPNWPHQSVPVSNCVHLVDCVAKLLQAPVDAGMSASGLSASGLSANGPVVVMDSFGATEAAIFCVLSGVVKQLDLEVCIYALISANMHVRQNNEKKSKFISGAGSKNGHVEMLLFCEFYIFRRGIYGIELYIIKIT
jgi:hypothetical protein